MRYAALWLPCLQFPKFMIDQRKCGLPELRCLDSAGIYHQPQASRLYPSAAKPSACCINWCTWQYCSSHALNMLNKKSLLLLFHCHLAASTDELSIIVLVKHFCGASTGELGIIVKTSTSTIPSSSAWCINRWVKIVHWCTMFLYYLDGKKRYLVASISELDQQTMFLVHCQRFFPLWNRADGSTEDN